MKKILFFAMAMILLTGVLAGCGGSQNELDFKSVRDTETGEIISLGDTKESVEKVLGAGEYGENEILENRVYYKYLNSLVWVYYDTENIAIDISVDSNTSRIEFIDVKFNMKREDFIGEYKKSDLFAPYYESYYRYYNSSGKVIEEEVLGGYTMEIDIYAEDSYLGREGEIDRVRIQKNIEN